MNLFHLSEIAIKAAHLAGEVIQKYSNDKVKVGEKDGGTSHAAKVVTAVDIECEQIILTQLLPTCEKYDLAILSEETEDDGSRFIKDFFWCIDPMDGTLAFINGYPGFSVSIALVAKDGTPVIGIVFDPSTNTLYHAIKGNGAFKNGTPWKITKCNHFITYVSDRMLQDTPQKSAIQSFLHKAVQEMGLIGIRELSGAGSVLNAIRVLENGPACMLKHPKNESGGGSIWDYAATACIYQELGLPATNFAGNKLDLNRTDDSFMNHEGILFTNF